MTLPSSRRCFQCDQHYPVPVGVPLLRCPADGGLLAPPVVGKHWSLDGVLAPRPAGGLFLASHELTGAHGALTLILDQREPTAADDLQAEVRAQQILEPHPSLLKVLEVGKEADGSSFYVSELRGEQLLSELLAEWRHPASESELLLQAIGVVRPLLRLLSQAHQKGIAHGALTASHVFVYAGDSVLGEAPVLNGPRLQGLRRIGKGPAHSTAAQADLAAMGQLLHQLLVGRPARLPLPQFEQDAMRRRFGDPYGDFVLRALGISPSASQPGLVSVDEMLSELLTLWGDRASPDEGVEPIGAVCSELPSERTTRTAIPSQMSLSRRDRLARPRERELSSLPTAEPLLALPESEQQRLEAAQRYRLSGDFVSFNDLLSLAPPPAKNRILARARFQVSHQGDSFAPVATLNLPSEASAPEIFIEATSATVPGPREPASSVPRLAEPNLFAEPTQPLAERLVPRSAIAFQADAHPARSGGRAAVESDPAPAPPPAPMATAAERNADRAEAPTVISDGAGGRKLLPTFLRGALSRILKR